MLQVDPLGFASRWKQGGESADGTPAMDASPDADAAVRACDVEFVKMISVQRACRDVAHAVQRAYASCDGRAVAPEEERRNYYRLRQHCEVVPRFNLAHVFQVNAILMGAVSPYSALDEWVLRRAGKIIAVFERLFLKNSITNYTQGATDYGKAGADRTTPEAN